MSNQGTGVLPNQAASTLPKQGTNIHLVINAFLMHNKTSVTGTNTSKPHTNHKTGFSLLDRGKAILHHHCGDSLYDTSQINFGKKITTLYKVHLLVVLNTPYWKVSK